MPWCQFWPSHRVEVITGTLDQCVCMLAIVGAQVEQLKLRAMSCAGTGRLKLAYPSSHQYMMVWRQKPRTCAAAIMSHRTMANAADRYAAHRFESCVMWPSSHSADVTE